MVRGHGAKEKARAEVGGSMRSNAWNAEKRGLLKRTRVQVQEGSDGKSEPAPEDFVYV